MAKTPNENEIEKVLAKVDEFDSQAVKSTDDIDKLISPAEINGNIWAKGKGKKSKKKK